ncbi:MAG: SEC-C domain-containing protein [FCB group bacterium]|nr:SEC-C domain-containing protein [FCB group bacterium]
MGKKLGRNDPCLCGSGKKFKHCCGKTPVPQELTQEQWEDLYHSLNQRLLQYIMQPEFVEDFESAWDLFWAGEYQIEEMDQLSKVEAGAFLNYLIFGYLLLSSNRSVIDHFLDMYRVDLTLPERTLLDNMRKAFYGIYEVQEVRPAQGMRIKNMFDGMELEIKEISGTKDIVKWDVIAGYICKIGDFHEFAGNIIFIPRQIVNSTQAMLLDEHRQYETEYEAADFSLFLKHNSFLINQFVRDYGKHTPVIVNNEGDEIIFCKLWYEILDREKVLKRFAKDSMFVLLPEEDEEADDDHVHFNWQLKGVVAKRLKYSSKEIKEPYSVFADVIIKDKTLTVELMSERRKDVAKAYLKKQLRGLIQLEHEESKNLEEVKEEYMDDLDQDHPERNELMEDPEVQEFLTQRMDHYYYDEWINTPIPALDDLTPIEAYVEAPDKLEDLLKTFEQQELRNKSGGYHLDVEKLRRHIAKTAEFEIIDPQDNLFDEPTKIIIRYLTLAIVMRLNIDLMETERKKFVVEENSNGIFLIDDQPMIGTVRDISKNNITVDILGFSEEIISSKDVLHIFSPEQNDVFMILIDNIMRSVLRSIDFCISNDLQLDSREGDGFRAMVALLPEICNYIFTLVIEYSDTEVMVEINELEEDGRKQTRFIMKEKALELAEKDFFSAVLYPQDFFKQSLRLPEQKTKRFVDRLVVFIIYMVALCLFSLQYKRRYDFVDPRFKDLFDFLYDKKSQALSREIMPLLKMYRNCNLKTVKRLKVYFPPS